LVLFDPQIEYTIGYKSTKRCGKGKPSSTLFQNKFNWNVKYGKWEMKEIM